LFPESRFPVDQINGQLLLALACVAVAVAVLVRRFVLMIRSPGKSGCQSGGCGSCPSAKAAPSEGFVSLDQLTKPELPKM
jgi:hypothetical protein